MSAISEESENADRGIPLCHYGCGEDVRFTNDDGKYDCGANACIHARVERHAICPTYDDKIEGTKMVSIVIDGPTVSFENSEQTDEGWSSEGEFYDAHSSEWIDHVPSKCWIIFCRTTDGVDCDGRLSSDRTMIVQLKLAFSMEYTTSRPTRQEFWVPVLDEAGRVDWQIESSSQRDYNAEAAGY